MASGEYKLGKKEYSRIWREKNREKIRRQQAEYRERHRDRIRASHRQWVQDNQEKNAEHKHKWYVENKESVNSSATAYWKARPGAKAAHCAKRRAAKLNRTPPWANLRKIAAVYELVNWASKFTDEPLTVDHIIPLQGRKVSGLHVHENLQALTLSENSAKGNKWN